MQFEKQCGACNSYHWCGRQCATYTKVMAPKRKREMRPYKKGYISCVVCGTSFSGTARAKFCSRACSMKEYRSRRTSPDWRKVVGSVSHELRSVGMALSREKADRGIIDAIRKAIVDLDALTKP